MPHRIITAILLALLCVAPIMVNAEALTSRYDDALVTDRPDAAEASVTVGKQRFQIETSFGASQNKSGGTTTRSYNFPTLLRYGIVDALEVRVEGQYFNIQTATGTATQRGLADMEFGLKTHLVENNGIVPSFGILAHVNVPVGKDAFSSNGVEPVVKFLNDWELPAGFSLGTNVGADVPVRDGAGDKFARFLYAAAVGHAIPGTNDRLSAFVEGTGAIPLTSGKLSEHQFDTGLAFLITPNIQLDVSAEIGLNDNTTDFGGGLGFSWRI